MRSTAASPSFALFCSIRALFTLTIPTISPTTPTTSKATNPAATLSSSAVLAGELPHPVAAPTAEHASTGSSSR